MPAIPAGARRRWGRRAATSPRPTAIIPSQCIAGPCPGGPGQAFSYAFDRYGNRWQQNLVGGSGPAPQAQLPSGNNQDSSLSYDAAANVIYDGNCNYTYDAENRMIGYSGNCGTATFKYDYLGRLVTSEENGVNREYIYSPGPNARSVVANYNIVEQEFALNGEQLASYIPGDGCSTVQWVHTDQVGTKRMRTGLTGTAVGTYQSLPWGDGATTAGCDSDPLQFTGQHHDAATGLDFFPARAYGHTAAAFMSPDPAGFAAADLSNPQSLNLYGYVLGNPATNRDPLGLDSCKAQLGRGVRDACGNGPIEGEDDSGPTLSTDGGEAVSTDMFGGNGGGESAVPCPNNICTNFFAFAGGWAGYLDPSVVAAGVWDYQGQLYDQAEYTQLMEQEHASQVYAAYMLGCAYAQVSCSTDAVIAYNRGWTINAINPDVSVNLNAVADLFQDPAIFNALFHSGAAASWYTATGWGLFGFDVGHIVDDPTDLSSHYDMFGPFNPLHLINAIGGLLLGSGPQMQFICTAGSGCTPY